MAGPTSKSAWKGMERRVATAWGTTRTPLSGMNSGHGPGDIILTNSRATVECKLRAKFVTHTLFRAVQTDAKKHGKEPEFAFLYTKLKGERGELVTMDADTFHKWVLPILQAQMLKPTAPLATPGD